MRDGQAKVNLIGFVVVALVVLTLASACTTRPTKSTETAAAGGVAGGVAGGATSAGTNAGSPDYRGLGSESVAPEVVQKYAPPPLESNLSQQIRRMLEVMAPGLGVPSPDGKALYFTWRISGVAQVWKVDGPMRFPQQLTSGESSTSVVGVTSDGKYVIVSRDHAGQENPGVYLVAATGGELIEVQHIKGVRTAVDWVANDPDVLYLRANDIKPDSYAIYRYEISTRKKTLVFSQEGLWSIADRREPGTFLLAKSTGALTQEFFLFNETSGELKPLLGQGTRDEYEMTMGYRPGTYYVLTNKFSDFRRLYLWTPAPGQDNDGTWKAITPDVQREISEYDSDGTGKNVYVSWNNGGYMRLQHYDAASGRLADLPGLPKTADRIVRGHVSRFGRFVTVGVEDSFGPVTSYVFDHKTKRLTRWTLASQPEVMSSRFRPVTIENYVARDGTPIPMLVRRPEKCAAEPCPVVVNFHGGPEAQSMPGFSQLAQLMVAQGMIYVEPNVRGSSGYGKKWIAADDGPKRESVITDIEDCALHIKQKWSKNGVSPRVGVMGWSYGGYSTLMAMSRFAGSYDAGVALVGMSNLRSFLLNTAPYRRALRISEYGDPEKDAESLARLSPVTYVERVSAPLMIVQGVSDPRVPVGEALAMHKSLAQRGVSSQLILFAEAGHGTNKLTDRVLEIGHTVGFFRKHLLGASQP